MGSPTLWYRIAAVAYGVFALGHTVGAAAGSTRGPEEEATLRALGSYTFDIMGVTRSHLDFYDGLGWLLSVNLVFLTVLCWQLGALHRQNSRAAARIGVAAAVATVAISWLSWRDFFIAPALFSSIAAVALSIAVARGFAQDSVAA